MKRIEMSTEIGVWEIIDGKLKLVDVSLA